MYSGQGQSVRQSGHVKEYSLAIEPMMPPVWAASPDLRETERPRCRWSGSGGVVLVAPGRLYAGPAPSARMAMPDLVGQLGRRHVLVQRGKDPLEGGGRAQTD
jgi:hypothetical protein